MADASAAPVMPYTGMKNRFRTTLATAATVLTAVGYLTSPAAISVMPFGPSITWTKNPKARMLRA